MEGRETCKETERKKSYTKVKWSDPNLFKT